ncbi:MAG: VOC family protein [Verrucomicrobia bacterium]|nr:VOC family protein [Verrucomicrobiota bacterium]
MRLTGIHHVSILVSDVPRAIAFYRDGLGLRQVERPSTFTAPELRDVIWFELGDQQLHLLPAPVADVPARRHFALHIDDAAAARAELQRKGVVVRETTPIPGADRFFVNDPDGNRIELIQWKEMYPVKYL